MNTRCKICFDLQMSERLDIEKRLTSGERNKTILDDYPHINRWNLKNHIKHIANPQNDMDIEKFKVARALARVRLKDWDCEAFIVDLRERLQYTYLEAQERVENYGIEVDEGLRPISDLNDAVAISHRLFMSLDYVGGIKQMVNLDAAFGTLLKEGYKISE